jgi:hypothetical protein
MAMWCPNCLVQSNEVRKLHQLLGNPDDLISVSLDVDVNEESAALKEYASKYGFDWHYAIAPLGVARALGNLTAVILNPLLRWSSTVRARNITLNTANTEFRPAIPGKLVAAGNPVFSSLLGLLARISASTASTGFLSYLSTQIEMGWVDTVGVVVVWRVEHDIVLGGRIALLSSDWRCSGIRHTLGGC